ncbi:uncharacterized protein RAG0_06526 [Rhynchosporium agropyri]|uniref:N-acetyltransferase domain-containing protein n=1 Tax=Rhynchosporium agropyri TaxID=914238 RepID=A0A1E1KHB3_9HELO|nr:uncharacterized protein RAG0_06526 [Rhynchosporium agropyri]
MFSPTSWHFPNFLISANPTLIQPSAINEAFGTEAMYWAKAMNESVLKKMLDNSLCFGVYALPNSSAEIAGMLLYSQHLSNFAIPGRGRISVSYLDLIRYLLLMSMVDDTGRSDPPQIGLARLITDRVSFAYLTDVYMLEQYQEALLPTTQKFRRTLLVSDTKGKGFYEQMLGMKELVQGGNGFTMMTRKGPGSVIQI